MLLFAVNSPTMLATTLSLLVLFSTDSTIACTIACQTFDLSWQSTCVLTDHIANNVICFGNNSYNRLGDASFGSTNALIASSMPPERVDLGGARAIEISLGAKQSCILVDDGSVRCWGASDDANDAAHTDAAATAPPHVTSIVFDEANTAAANVAAGYSHVCVLLVDGNVACFGDNTYGQCGAPPAAAARGVATARVQMPYNVPVKQVCAGEMHTCVLTMYGDVACFGDNSFGQLGYARSHDGQWNASLNGFVSLTSDPSQPMPAVRIACGAKHSAALLANGKLKTWGYEIYGQLGYSYTQRVGAENVPSFYNPKNGFVDEFVRLYASNDSLIVDVACGGYHTCALTDQRELFCFGVGWEGALGAGSTDLIGGFNRTQAYEVGAVDVNVVAVEAGRFHTCVLYQGDLSMKCFGRGASGALGNEKTDNLGDTPETIPSSLPPLRLSATPMLTTAIHVPSTPTSSNTTTSSPFTTAFTTKTNSSSTSTTTTTTTTFTTATALMIENTQAQHTVDKTTDSEYALIVVLVVASVVLLCSLCACFAVFIAKRVTFQRGDRKDIMMKKRRSRRRNRQYRA